MDRRHAYGRRRFLAALGTAAAGWTCRTGLAQPVLAAPGAPIRRPIPASGELLPAIGLGTWITFDAGSDPRRRDALAPVLQAFFERGGTLIDSSPMYGSAEAVIGALLPRMLGRPVPFAATKVWIVGRGAGIGQMEASRRLWGVPRFDLMQIHNMVDWPAHLKTLKAWKAEGRVRYIGITTSHGRRHAEMEKAIATEPFDFVQFTYNFADREAERRLLPLAAERGVAVIANRPFDGGNLFARVQGRPLPPWARDFDCATWAAFFLKFVVSHPAVTCAIPATSQAPHMLENMGALYGRLPDAATRERMIRHFEAL
ncbi:MAG TPA: aldo/keto reductase [Burkholderiales bacterium]|jgi:diketogulonate reductase-like aldo/keto reductase|nr:aldo/keto reductase [Burkholderiales bacterium]